MFERLESRTRSPGQWLQLACRRHYAHIRFVCQIILHRYRYSKQYDCNQYVFSFTYYICMQQILFIVVTYRNAVLEYFEQVLCREPLHEIMLDSSLFCCLSLTSLYTLPLPCYQAKLKELAADWATLSAVQELLT